jgi:hypothetical protein
MPSNGRPLDEEEEEEEDSGFATHILRNTHQYGKIDDIIERIDYPK